MELNQLRQFQSIARHNSISLAAEDLHISQPALSTMLKKLEGELGISLFDRTRNKLTLNEAGKLALEHVELILSDVEKMQNALKKYSTTHSHIRIGFCDPGPMWYCVPQLSMLENPFLYECYSITPDESTLLLNSHFDILISSQKLQHPDIISKLLLPEQIYLSIDSSHELAREKELSLCDPRIKSLFLFTVDGAFQKKQSSFWKKIQKNIPITFTTDFFLFSQTIKNPELITTTTRLVSHYRNDGNNRVLIPLRDPELKIDYHISYICSSENRLHDFIQTLEQCAANI